MSTDSPPINLTHHFLIAMPGLHDENFHRSVVYLCEHSERGALGLVINKPSDLDMQGLFQKVDLRLTRDDLAHQPVLQGGPVHTERGFVLHESMRAFDGAPFPPSEPTPAATEKTEKAEKAETAETAEPGEATDVEQGVYASTLTIPGGLEMTTSRDVLEALSNGAGPRKVLISLGYSAWGQGQLESEIAENSWLTVGADPQVIFDTPIEQRYERALSLLGLQAWMLSPDAGHA
jgi:putative transcriptional regulator